MKRIAFILCVASGLGGCALAAQMEARHDYQGSETAYKECLASHAPNQCENLRLAMEADERKFNAMSAGMNPGAQRSGTLTVINR